MALDRQLVTLPFTGGLDTKTDPRQTPMAQLQSLENAVFTRPGSLRKKFGYAPLSREIANPFNPDAPLFDAGLGLAAFNRELVAFDPSRLLSYDVGTEKWIDKGSLVSARVTQSSVVRNAYGQTNQDGVTHAASGLQMYAWEDSSGGVRYTIIDAPTGQVVVGSTLVGLDARKPKVVAIGNYLVLWWLDGGGAVNVLKSAAVSIANPTAALVPVTMTGDGGSDWRQISTSVPSYDVTIIQGNGEVTASMYLAFSNATTPGGCSIYAYAQSDLTSPFGMDHSIDAAGYPGLTIFGDVATFGPVVVGWTGSAIETTAFEPFDVAATQTQIDDFTFSTGDPVIGTITGVSTSRDVAGTWRIAYTTSPAGGATFDDFVTLYEVDAYTPATPAVLLASVSLSAKAWSYNGLAYFPLVYVSPLDSTTFVADENGNIVMRALAGTAGGAPLTGNLYASGSATLTGVPVSLPSIVQVVFGPYGTGKSVFWETSNEATLQALADLINEPFPGYHPATAVAVGNTITWTAIIPGPAGAATTVTTTDDAGLTFTASGPTMTLPAGTSSGQAILPETCAIDPEAPTEETAAVAATGAITMSGLSGTVGAVINGVSVTVTASGGDAATRAAWLAAVNSNAFVGPLVTVSGTGSPLTITAKTPGADGNAITVTAVGTGVVFAEPGGHLNGGVDATYTYPEHPNWRWAALVRDFLSTFPATTTTGTSTTATYTQSGVTALNFEFFNARNSYVSETLGQSLNIGGGFLVQYDGVKPVELGFHVYPELTDDSITTADTGGELGSATQETTYWWVNLYAWTDNNGLVHRSTPSIPISKTFASGVDTGSASIEIPTLRLTAKAGSASPVVIETYRTIGTSPGIFYLANVSTAPAASPATNQSVINDLDESRVVFVDELSDADLIGNPRLYTTGNVLENSAPPPCNSLVVFQNRLVGIDSTNPLVLFYSQQVVPGTPVEFSDFLTINLDPQIGGATALAVIDDKLILCGETSLYYVNGSFPDATGAGSGLQDPQRVPGSTGCDNPKSVVSTEDGAAFQSRKGIYLLTRGLQPVYAGARVEELLDGATVTSALAIPTTTQTRFALDTGKVVVFDSLVQQWSAFTGYDAVDAVIWGGQFTHLRDDGAVFVETPDAYSDGSSWIQTALTTAPIRIGALAGFQRVRLVEISGMFESPHDLEVSIRFDGNPADVQTVVVSPESPDTWGTDATWGSGEVWGGRWQPYIFRVYLNRQKCSDVQITIRDTQAGETPGAGMSLSGLTFEIGSKKGANKAPATSTFGG